MRIAECKFLTRGESLISRNVFHSASSDSRDLWSKARWIRQRAGKGKPFSFRKQFRSLPQGLLMAWGQASWSWSWINLIPATGYHRNKHMAVILGLSFLKNFQSFVSEERWQRCVVLQEHWRVHVPLWWQGVAVAPGQRLNTHTHRVWQSNQVTSCWLKQINIVRLN